MVIQLLGIDFKLHRWNQFPVFKTLITIHDIWIECDWFTVRSDSSEHGTHWEFTWLDYLHLKLYIYRPSVWMRQHYRTDALTGWIKVAQHFLRVAFTFQLLFVRVWFKFDSAGHPERIMSYYPD